MTKEAINELKKYTSGRKNTEKVEVSVLALNRIIFALEQEPCEDAISRQAVLNTLEFCDKVLNKDRTVENYKSLLAECYKVLTNIQPKTDVLNKIRTEIEEQKQERCFDDDDMLVYRTGLDDALYIIDKYKAESKESATVVKFHDDPGTDEEKDR